jgi:hypothetical protein
MNNRQIVESVACERPHTRLGRSTVQLHRPLRTCSAYFQDNIDSPGFSSGLFISDHGCWRCAAATPARNRSEGTVIYHSIDLLSDQHRGGGGFEVTAAASGDCFPKPL